ncbi:MAG: DUF5104 domain-containing protein [Ruminococcus sp.]|nr:DUF5104 domain-containing protein [Ruminococcus sp.]
MKRVIGFILCAVMMFVFCSCDAVDIVVDIINSPSWTEIDEMQEKLCQDTNNAILQKDTAKLMDLFCETNKTEALKEETSKFLSRIEGNITSVSEYEDYRYSHFVYDSVDYAFMTFRADTVKTDKGRNYSLAVYLCVNDKENEKNVGLQALVLYENENKLCKIGKIIEGYIPQKVSEKYVKIDFDKEDKYEAEKAFMMNLLYYLNQDDKDGFVSMFDGATRSKAEAEYYKIKNMIDGKFVTWSTIDRHGGACGSVAYGHWTDMSNEVDIYDVLTDSGKMYQITIHAEYVNEIDPYEVGIDAFSISLVENELDDTTQHEVISKIEF